LPSMVIGDNAPHASPKKVTVTAVPETLNHRLIVARLQN
jgi:hypothetical protein